MYLPSEKRYNIFVLQCDGIYIGVKRISEADGAKFNKNNIPGSINTNIVKILQSLIASSK